MNKREKLSYVHNNSKEIKSEYKEQWESFKGFAFRYPDTCLQMDGIVKPEIWTGQRLKIMTFLKDSYRTDMKDYVSAFVLNLCNSDLTKYKDKREISTWWNVFKWVNAIRESLGEEKESSLRSIAHMNVSKMACNGKESVYTRAGALEEAIEEDVDLLYAQYKAIAPNIVICGNTFSYFSKVLQYGEGEVVEKIIFKEPIEGKRPLYCYEVNGVLVFAAYHPSVLRTKPSDYKLIIDKHQEEIRKILGL